MFESIIFYISQWAIPSFIVEKKTHRGVFKPEEVFTEVFTGSPGKYVGLVETIRGFQLILSGELDGLPEQAFYLVGNIDEATAKAMNFEMENKLNK